MDDERDHVQHLAGGQPAGELVRRDLASGVAAQSRPLVEVAAAEHQRVRDDAEDAADRTNDEGNPRDPAEHRDVGDDRSDERRHSGAPGIANLDAVAEVIQAPVGTHNAQSL